MSVVLDSINLIIGLILIGVVVSFTLQHGFLRGGLASLLRFVWLAPFFLALYPKSIQQALPRSVQARPVHVLIDDSQSMNQRGSNIPEAASAQLNHLKKECEILGCRLEETKLSQLRPEVEQGFTPLGEAVTSWSFGVGNDPWVIISDGGDWRPTLSWNERLKSLANEKAFASSPDQKKRGLILGLSENDENNVWIDTVNAPPFSFEGQSFELSLSIARSPSKVDEAQTVQVQVMLEDQSLASLDATFDQKTSQITVPVSVPSLPRGQHLLNVKVLPTPSENSLWDNDSYLSIEVLPNTIGLLHLLGSPSWGGRYLRRYLKAEPKFDLISFFILRDRMDNQAVSERELSLIPFPVERLFRDELPNFKVVIIQNFAVFDFLEEENQKRLVQFVKNGGGLLFLGGPRSLQPGDLGSSTLGSILPFDVSDSLKKSATLSRNPFFKNVVSKEGPFYDKDMRFSIEMAEPDPQKRALANVFESWEKMSASLRELGPIRGMHRTDQVKFKKDSVTPLLEAHTTNGEKFPLAVASYPDKGRAIWLFTDQIWRLAMNSNNRIARSKYHEFIQGAMSWLLRKEFRQPLVIRYFDVQQGEGENFKWTAGLQGPASRYFDAGSNWTVDVCGVRVPIENLGIERLSAEEYQIAGSVQMKVAGGQRCRLTVEGESAAFGSTKASITSVVPETFSDSQLSSSRGKLQKLANLTDANLEFEPKKMSQVSSDWLASLMEDGGVALPKRYKTSLDYYWFLKEWWFWILLLALPIEIVIRRWPELFSESLNQNRNSRQKVS